MSLVAFLRSLQFFQVLSIYIFTSYQLLIISNKRSRALSRLEDHNTTSPQRVQDEHVVNESQRKSKKTEKSAEKSAEKSIGPSMDENVFVSLYSKRSKEKSPSKKRSRSRSRSRSPRRKRSRTQSPRSGPSGDRHSVSSESGASSSARGRTCRDRDVTPEWVRFIIQTQQSSEERLLKFESELKRSSGECNSTTMTPNRKFDMKIYVDQFEFDVKIAGILLKALWSSDELDKDLHLNQGIELITRRNKLLVLADMYGWEVVEAYTADPLADDSADEKKIRKAKKEGKLLRDQK